jgi:electron transport complex protein RnfE
VVREVLGSGSIFGVDLFGPAFQPWSIFVLPPGGFFVLAFWLFLFSVVRKRRALTRATEQEVHDAA